MTIDEAIKHAREVAKGNREKCTQYDFGCDKFSKCLECAEEHEQLAKRLEELKKYRAIGTVEECREAVEKQKTIKPHKNFEKFSGVWCSCGKYLGKGYFVDKPNYCPDCGQKLDWRDEEQG